MRLAYRIPFCCNICHFAAVYALKPPYYNTCADLKGGGGNFRKGWEVPPLPPPCMNPCDSHVSKIPRVMSHDSHVSKTPTVMSRDSHVSKTPTVISRDSHVSKTPTVMSHDSHDSHADMHLQRCHM